VRRIHGRWGEVPARYLGTLLNEPEGWTTSFDDRL